MDSKSYNVGFIGLGDQGLPMAVAIAENGLPLHVWDRRTSSLDHLGKAPHRPHDTIASLASACDIICLCVRTDDDVRDVLSNGVLEGLRPDGIVVNHGTGTPTNAKRFAEMCQAREIHSLDAPVSGARQGAEARTLTTLVGGQEQAAKRCEPLFKSFSKHIVYLGEPGAGQAAKLFNNALMILNQNNVNEILTLADKFGMDLWQLISALKLCSGFSNTLLHLNTILTPQTIGHLAQVEVEDMLIFKAAMDEAGIDAERVTERGILAANALPSLIARLNQ